MVPAVAWQANSFRTKRIGARAPRDFDRRFHAFILGRFFRSTIEDVRFARDRFAAACVRGHMARLARKAFLMEKRMRCDEITD